MSKKLIVVIVLSFCQVFIKQFYLNITSWWQIMFAPWWYWWNLINHNQVEMREKDGIFLHDDVNLTIQRVVAMHEHSTSVSNYEGMRISQLQHVTFFLYSNLCQKKYSCLLIWSQIGHVFFSMTTFCPPTVWIVQRVL